MTWAEFVKTVAHDARVRRGRRKGMPGLVARLQVEDTKAVLEAFVEHLRRADRVVVPGFGTFRRKTRAPKRFVAPDGREVHTPAREVLTFAPTKGTRR